MAAPEPSVQLSADSEPSHGALDPRAIESRSTTPPTALPGVTVRFVESIEALWALQMDTDREAAAGVRELFPGSSAARPFEVAVAPASAIISQHPDNFAGLHFNWYAGRVDIHVVDPDGAGMAEVHQLMRDNGAAYFQLVVVPFSESAMLSAQNRLVDEMDGRLKDMGLSQVNSDWRRGRLQAVFDSGCTERVARTTRIRSLATGSDVDLQRIACEIGVGIDVAIQTWVPVVATSL